MRSGQPEVMHVPLCNERVETGKERTVGIFIVRVAEIPGHPGDHVGALASAGAIVGMDDQDRSCQAGVDR